MTLEETEKFLHLVGLNFPNAFKGIKSKEDKELIASQWQANFSNISATDMALLLNDYLSCGIDVATPSLGQLLGDLKKMINKKIVLPQMSVPEAWQIVLRNAKCNEATSRSNYNKLPLNIRKALGSSAMLVDIAYCNSEKLEWRKKDFDRNFNDVISTEREQYLLGHATLEDVSNNNQLPMSHNIGIGYENKN